MGTVICLSLKGGRLHLESCGSRVRWEQEQGCPPMGQQREIFWAVLPTLLTDRPLQWSCLAETLDLQPGLYPHGPPIHTVSQCLTGINNPSRFEV